MDRPDLHTKRRLARLCKQKNWILKMKPLPLQPICNMLLSTSIGQIYFSRTTKRSVTKSLLAFYSQQVYLTISILYRMLRWRPFRSNAKKSPYRSPGNREFSGYRISGIWISGKSVVQRLGQLPKDQGTWILFLFQAYKNLSLGGNQATGTCHYISNWIWSITNNYY